MNDLTRHGPAVDEHPQPPPASAEKLMPEQPLGERPLSDSARRFLHDLHLAERRLNAACSVAREDGELEQRIRRVYREMFGPV